jgi:hypothetical protein
MKRRDMRLDIALSSPLGWFGLEAEGTIDFDGINRLPGQSHNVFVINTKNGPGFFPEPVVCSNEKALRRS